MVPDCPLASPSLERGKNVAKNHKEKQMDGYAVFMIEDQGKLHLLLTSSGIEQRKQLTCLFLSYSRGI